MPRDLEWKVGRGEGGVRLLAFLREKCKEAPSVKALKRAIDSKYCSVNGQSQTFSSCVLQEGDHVLLHEGAFEKKEPPAVPILYEDEDLLVVNKPSGLTSDLRDLKLRGVHLVHRLDKETSGVLLLAKRKEVEKKLLLSFRKREVHKLYLALVDGKVGKEEGKIENELGKKGSYEGQTLYGRVPKGARAITHWKVLSRGKSASLVRCEPLTGRTHQLRVHLSEMGHPILGDRQYASHFICSYHPHRNLLHAYLVQFPHPRSGKLIKVVAPIPLDFQRALKELSLSL